MMPEILLFTGIIFTILIWLCSLFFVLRILNADLEQQKRVLTFLTKKFLHSSFLPRWGDLSGIRKAKNYEEWTKVLRKQVGAVALKYSITVLFIFLIGFLVMSKDLKAFIYVSFILAPLAWLYSLYLIFIYLLMKKTNNEGVYHMVDQFLEN